MNSAKRKERQLGMPGKSKGFSKLVGMQMDCHKHTFMGCQKRESTQRTLKPLISSNAQKPGLRAAPPGARAHHPSRWHATLAGTPAHCPARHRTTLPRGHVRKPTSWCLTFESQPTGTPRDPGNSSKDRPLGVPADQDPSLSPCAMRWAQQREQG